MKRFDGSDQFALMLRRRSLGVKQVVVHVRVCACPKCAYHFNGDDNGWNRVGGDLAM